MNRRRGQRPGDVRVVIGRGAKLPRTLSARALFAACYGNVGSSIYYSLGVVAGVALGLTPLALILAGGIFITTALNYAEGTAAMPHAGGSSAFARRAFNEPIGFLVGWIQLLNFAVTVSISAYTAISYLTVFDKYVGFFGTFRDPFAHAIAAVVLTGLLMFLNVVGIQESSVINLTLAMLDLVTQLVLVTLGVFLLLHWDIVLKNIHWGVAPTWGNFLASVSLAMVTYTGIETISNLSEEARNPGRAVPRAYFGVIVAVLIVSSLLPTVAMSVFPVHLDSGGNFVTDLATNWKDDPVAGVVTFFTPPWLAFWAGVWVAILAFTILVIATNAGLIGISRLSYSLAQNDLFPKAFSKLHPQFKTPFVSIIVFGIVAAVLILPAKIDLMGAVYSLAATFAFATAHLAVMRLRFVEPELYRPYLMPINIRFGRASIPVLSVIGALAIGSVFTQLLFQNIEQSTWIFVVWLIVGALAYIAYRKYRGDPLWEPLEAPPPPDREVAHERVPLPRADRIRLGRRQRVKGYAAAELPTQRVQHRRTRFLGLRLMIERHGRMRLLLSSAVFLGVTVAAILADLSPLDPFGPKLGWSPGVILIAAFTLLLLVRSGGER
jgi:APA family basic amino acid/polyamine antiporter